MIRSARVQLHLQKKFTKLCKEVVEEAVRKNDLPRNGKYIYVKPGQSNIRPGEWKMGVIILQVFNQV